MRHLFVNTNRAASFPIPPLGLMYLSTPLKKAGHDVRLLDLTFSRRPVADLERAIRNDQPDVVSFTIRNLDMCDMLRPASFLPEVRELVQLAKRHGKSTVLGGGAFTTLPEPVLKFMGADYGIAGQGDRSYAALAEALAGRRSTDHIAGLLSNGPEGIRRNAFAPRGYRDAEVPDWELIDFAPYRRRSPFPGATIVKTGCPYPCSYCDTRTHSGTTPIRRDEDAIVDDLRRMKRMRLENVYLIDPGLNTPMDPAKALLERIIREDVGVKLYTSMMPDPRHFDDELFSLYRRAGGRFVMMGAEAFSDPMLQSYRKTFTTADVRRFVAMGNRHGVRVGIEALFGGPGETHDTVRESLGVLGELEYSLLTYGVGIRILPNTEIYALARAEGLFQSDEELLFPKYYFSKTADFQWIVDAVRRTARRYAYRQLWMLPGILLSRLNVFA